MQEPRIEMDETYPAKVVFFYLFSFIWLSLIPIFADNADHFGFGLIPGVLSFFIIPALFFVSMKHLLLFWQESAKLNQFSTLGKITLMLAAVANSLLSTLCFLFFYLA